MPRRSGCVARGVTEGYMAQLLGFLSLLLNIYMLIILFRIILTWFPGFGNSGIIDFLSMITDPYLNWFRRFSFLRLGFLDLSPIVALGILSLVNRILAMLASYGRISLGIVLVLALQAVWGAVSFILGFLILILILRLIAFLFRQSGANPFWNIIETISQPVLYRINRIFFRGRIVKLSMALIVSIASLAIIYMALRFLFALISVTLIRLPF
jgi:YggT family protein